MAVSTTGPMTERVVKGVLLALWRRRETTMQGLLAATLAPLPDVQEAMVALRRRGCLIEQTPAEVRLVSTGLKCWQDVLEELAREKELRVGRQVKVFGRTGSTNDVAWQFATNDDADGLVVVADEQTAGRGRMGHAWVAKTEQSVLMSVVLKGRSAGEVERVTLLAGLAVAEGVEQAIDDATGLHARVEIKWPNDLLIEGRKLAGILVEKRGGDVVVGLGINVAQGIGDFPKELAGRATSVYQATGLLVDRLRVAAAVAGRLDGLCVVEADDGWLAKWKARCGMLGRNARLKCGEREITGLVVDVDPLQGLVVRDGSGAMQFLSAQRTTVAGTN